MKEGRKFRFKIAIIGDTQVGKTSLIEKFTKFRDHNEYTGVKFSAFDIEIEGDNLRLIFWDIAAGDDFLFLRPSFYRESRAVIIVCSLEDTEQGKESFTHIAEWYMKVTKFCGEIPTYIFANKVDLVDENSLNETDFKKLVDENNFRGYYLTSAIIGDSVIKAFNDISKELYKKYKKL